MKVVFADTSFYIASANPRDTLHGDALNAAEDHVARFLTTEYVLLELGNYFSTSNRRLFVELIEVMETDPNTEIVPASSILGKKGLDLYRSRPDKTWSLTDCISFIVMRQRGIGEALTSDHHFAQAGFQILLG